MFCVAKVPNVQRTLITTIIICVVLLILDLLLSFEKTLLSLNCEGFVMVKEFQSETITTVLEVPHSIYGAWIQEMT